MKDSHTHPFAISEDLLLSILDEAKLDSGDAHIRALLAHLTDTSSNNFIQHCVEGIVKGDGWKQFCLEITSFCEPTRQNLALIAGVFRVRCPDHPLTSIDDFTDVRVVPVYDGMIEGDRILFQATSAERSGLRLGAAILLSVFEPAAMAFSSSISVLEGGRICLQGSGLSIFNGNDGLIAKPFWLVQ